MTLMLNAEINFNQLPEIDQALIVDQFCQLAKYKRKDNFFRLIRMINPKMKVKFFKDSGHLESFQFMEESRTVMLIGIRNYIYELI